jgi:hypothetical protein
VTKSPVEGGPSVGGGGIEEGEGWEDEPELDKDIRFRVKFVERRK